MHISTHAQTQTHKHADLNLHNMAGVKEVSTTVVGLHSRLV